VEAFLQGIEVLIEHHPNAEKEALFIKNMTKEDIQRCGIDLKVFDREFDLLSIFKRWVWRAVRRKGHKAYGLKLGEVYTSGDLSASVPLGKHKRGQARSQGSHRVM